MSLLGFLASSWWAWIALVVAVILVIVALFAISEDHPIGAVIAAVFAVLLIIEFFYGNTHRVVPLNSRGVVIDSTNGTINGETRNSGVTAIPMLGSKLYLFPSVSNQQICSDFTPSVKGGYEVKITICFFSNMGKMDWVNQIQKYNKYDYDSLVGVWITQIAPKVAESVKGFIPSDLTEQRATVSEKIKEATKDWFANENMVLNSVAISNWDFTNPAVAQAYDQTVVARTSQLKAEAELDAANTRIKAIQTMADGQTIALKKLGISGEDATVQWLYLQWLQGLNTNPVVVVNSGGNSAPIVGINQNQIPLPTATPAK